MNSANQNENARLNLTVLGRPLQVELSFPSGPAQPQDLLPALRILDDALIRLTMRAAEDTGLRISCKKGCAACCRKLVFISATEARRIRELLDELPEPKRSEVSARFARAREELQEAGLLEPLLGAPERPDEELWSLGKRYFQFWIACPFLEEENCTIFAERPFACREQLVTSPAEHCFPESSVKEVEQFCLPGSVSRAVAGLGRTDLSKSAGWVPLIVAPEWAKAQAAEIPASTGTAILEEVLQRLMSEQEPK